MTKDKELLPIPWQQINAAIWAVQKESESRGRMFPQTRDEDVADKAAARRVVKLIEWYATNGGSVAEQLPDWPKYPAKPDLPVHEQMARFAIDGAITSGYQGTNKPEEDHWLYPFWIMGEKLMKAEVQHTGSCPLCDQRAEEDAKPSWRCFHCDEVFNDFSSARAHFGLYQNQKPACTIDEKEYRRMEFLHLSHMEEDTALHRIIAGLESKHQAALQREEEKGYSRGLHDSPDGWQLVPVIALSRAATMLAALGHKAVADDLLSAAQKERDHG